MANAHDRRKSYGDLALEYDAILGELRTMQKDILASYKQDIGCQVARLYFVCPSRGELIFFDKNKWYRVPAQSSITGHCYLTGEAAHIPDAYADPHFNKCVILMHCNIFYFPYLYFSFEIYYHFMCSVFHVIDHWYVCFPA